jgi:hypothetical protein
VVAGDVGPVTVNICGRYVAVSEGSPPLKQIAVTATGPADAFAGITNAPFQDPSAATARCSAAGGDVVETTST